MQNQQVTLMGEIYGTTECLIVWLGLADALTPSAWEALGIDARAKQKNDIKRANIP